MLPLTNYITVEKLYGKSHATTAEVQASIDKQLDQICQHHKVVARSPCHSHNCMATAAETGLFSLRYYHRLYNHYNMHHKTKAIYPHFVELMRTLNARMKPAVAQGSGTGKPATQGSGTGKPATQGTGTHVAPAAQGSGTGKPAAQGCTSQVLSMPTMTQAQRDAEVGVWEAYNWFGNGPNYHGKGAHGCHEKNQQGHCMNAVAPPDAYAPKGRKKGPKGQKIKFGW